MLRASSITLGLLASLSVLAAPHAASACGGVFPTEETPVPGQPPETITVAGQRMALSISSQQTVLWSQVQYEGNPSEFAWVIPVGSGANVEQATDAWFEALDTFTTSKVQPPSVVCVSEGEAQDSGGGLFSCGCGSLGDAAPGGGFDAPPRQHDDVEVLHHGSVGPYETFTIDTSSGDAAQQWLAQNGFAVPPEVAPVLDAYASEGLDFIAMRLRPGADVQQMTPVRVVAPGGSPIVPMRMMVAGAGEKVPVTLFVLGEGRYAPENFPSAFLDPAEVSWDFEAELSNYGDVRAAALGAEGGRGFLTTFAMRQPFTTPLLWPGSLEQVQLGGEGVDPVTTLVDLYFAQAAANGGSPVGGCDAKGYLADQYLKVVEACADGSTDAGPCADGETITAASFACGDSTDLAVALTGMRPDTVWLTRLEAMLPPAVLTADLQLGASPDQKDVSPFIKAQGVENVPCDDYYIENTGAEPQSSRTQGAVGLVLAAGAASTLLRRRRRPQR